MQKFLMKDMACYKIFLIEEAQKVLMKDTSCCMITLTKEVQQFLMKGMVVCKINLMKEMHQSRNILKRQNKLKSTIIVQQNDSNSIIFSKTAHDKIRSTGKHQQLLRLEAQVEGRRK